MSESLALLCGIASGLSRRLNQPESTVSAELNGHLGGAELDVEAEARAWRTRSGVRL
jgi:DNA transposition AAA+ family ATPase